MNNPRIQRPGITGLAVFALLGAIAMTFALPAHAQYFGRNKVNYEKFDFKVLKTEHFDIHFYPEDNEMITDAAFLAERWYSRLSRVFDHRLSSRKPIILYANHADFQQTNTTEGGIGEGTGGFTDFLKNRVVLPMTGDYAGLDHVLGHELVHAFQFDVAAAGVDSLPFRVAALPLWMVEGIAEYLSVGRDDAHTAMWMRDAIIHDNFPTIHQLSTDPNFFPYRFGEALFAFIGGEYGDNKVTDFYKLAGRRGAEYAFSKTIGMSSDSLSKVWGEATRAYYMPTLQGRVVPDSLENPVLTPDRESGRINLAPAVSPDGKFVAYLSEKDLFSIGLILADAESGRIIRKLVNSATSPHFDALRFIDSAGTWSPDGSLFAFSVFANGDNDLIAVDTRGKVKHRLRMKGSMGSIGAISTPAWSPDGKWIAFSGDKRGISDLFMVHVETHEVKQLTNDRYTAMQPAWSPDGKTLAFVTDRGPGTDIDDELTFGKVRLAFYDMETEKIDICLPFPGSKHINPQFSPDGHSLFFISDREGFSNIYRLDLETQATYQVTNVATGVSGITALSPAMTVAKDTGRILYSVYAGSEYLVYGIDPSETAGMRLLPFAPEDTRSRFLPPLERPEEDDLVDRYLHDPKTGLPYNDDYQVTGYKPKISLDYVGTPTAGLAVDRFGAQLVGGVSAYFSDMLGNHIIGAGIMANGGIKDIGAQAFYQNRTRRWNWGATVGHVPFLSYFTSIRDTTIQSESGELDGLIVSQIRERTYVDSGRLFAFYPFSTTRRFEVSGGFSLINYERELFREVNVGGVIVQRSEGKVPAPPGLALGQGALAYVHDSSFFGFTSPIRGTRYRLEVGPTLGTLNYYSILVDYRKYFFTRQATMAFRALHLGRYGKDAEDPLLTEFFIGYPVYVRGYSSGSYSVAECSRGFGSDCTEFDRLIGSRFAVTNVELRIPFIGIEGYGLINFPYLPTELVLFGDAGVAWNQESDPVFEFSAAGANRAPVTSAGVSSRFNLLGALILEVYWAYPFQRPIKGGHWGLQLAPGW